MGLIFYFPEGTRSRGIGMHHFKAGSFKIMHKTDALLVMCAIDGSYRKRLSIPFVFTPVYIKIVEVMPSEICMRYTTQELASYLEKKVKKPSMIFVIIIKQWKWTKEC